jgi:exopolysaccharide/PEP-CTERM locus tyrosine autokinase
MALNQSDYDALVNYDQETGHLVRYDRDSGQVDERNIDALRHQGTIQRLLDNELIYPAGKLTQRGLDEVYRLELLKIAQRKPKKEIAVAEPAMRRVTEATPRPAAPPREPVAKKDKDQAELRELPQDTPSVDKAPSMEKLWVKLPSETPLSPPVLKPPEAAAVSTSKPPSLGTGVDLQTRGTPSPVSYDERAIDPDLVALNDPSSYEAEQFKILRTNILYPVAGNPPRSILVTSAGPEEGKSFSAANLAISIALNVNKHVLLIDGDLRNPQLHHRFGFGKVPGLSDYLSDGRPLAELLLKTKVDKLTLLPSGQPPANPSELISSERMASLIAEVTARYSDRLIVIDAPPPRLAAEAGVLARQVDGILIVVRYGRTHQGDLFDLIEQVGKKKILGTVVNFAEMSGPRYYGYKYGSYHKQAPAHR